MRRLPVRDSFVRSERAPLWHSGYD